jgi:ABC-2 type transport system ATP-binding protein
MDHGNLVASGDIEDIMDRVLGSNQLIITLEEGQETALRIVKEYAKVKVDSVGEHEIKLSHNMTKPEIAKLIGNMIENDVVVTGFHKEEGSLETLFMRVTGSEEGQEHAAQSDS